MTTYAETTAAKIAVDSVKADTKLTFRHVIFSNKLIADHAQIKAV
jgi:hypothetical protein